MDDSIGSDAANAGLTGDWYGWPSKDVTPVTLLDDEGRTVRIRTPVMDLEGLITPTNLHYTVQHFDVPPLIPADQWTLTIDGEVKNQLTLSLDDLKRFPGRSVRTVMECSGSDATFFEYLKGEGPRPSRTSEAMILSASEWTGVPLYAVLQEAGLHRQVPVHPRRGLGTSASPPPPRRAPTPSTTTRASRCRRPCIPTPFSLGPRMALCSSTCTVPRCAYWCPAGPATGRSSGSAALK